MSDPEELYAEPSSWYPHVRQIMPAPGWYALYDDCGDGRGDHAERLVGWALVAPPRNELLDHTYTTTVAGMVVEHDLSYAVFAAEFPGFAGYEYRGER